MEGHSIPELCLKIKRLCSRLQLNTRRADGVLLSLGYSSNRLLCSPAPRTNSISVRARMNYLCHFRVRFSGARKSLQDGCEIRDLEGSHLVPQSCSALTRISGRTHAARASRGRNIRIRSAYLDQLGAPKVLVRPQDTLMHAYLGIWFSRHLISDGG